MRNVIGQHLFIGISGHALTADEKKFIVANNISGVILFGRNVAEPKQVHALCSEIQSLRHLMPDKAPLFIGIDMEGGRVHRLKPPFTQWPPIKKLGDIDSPTASFNFSYCMGVELKAVGINLDFAPCVDIFSNPANTVIGDRAIGSDPNLVEKHASALVRGYLKAEVLPCVKHFPGHGNTIVDSHLDLPVEEADLNRLSSFELIPFKKTFRSRVQFVMTSHILFKNVDPDWPVTLSELFIQKILRQDLRYQGLVISDDLGMKAMASHFDVKKIPVRALHAGVDLLLYCNEPEVPPIAVDAIEEALKNKTLDAGRLADSHRRILATKKEWLTNVDPPNFEAASKLIGNADHFKLAQTIAKGETPTGLLNN